MKLVIGGETRQAAYKMKNSSLQSMQKLVTPLLDRGVYVRRQIPWSSHGMTLFLE